MTPNEAKKFIKKQIARWSYLVTCYGWKFDVYYHPNGHEMPAGNEDCYGVTYYKHQYLFGDIHFNLHTCAQLGEGELEEIVIHEITHMLLAPMQHEITEDNTERVTTMVSRLFKGLRQ